MASYDAMVVLEAAAQDVLAGLGPLVVGLAEVVLAVAGDGAEARTVDQVVAVVRDGGREVLRATVQAGLERASGLEVRRVAVVGADQVERTRVERGHVRHIKTLFGMVAVSRMAYRAPGVRNLYPLDAVLGLPERQDAHQLQRLGVENALEVSFDKARAMLAAATGIGIGHRQLQGHVRDAARDVEAFWAGREPVALQDPESVALVATADGKGVAVRPAAMRATPYKPVDPVYRHHPEPGMKTGHKRMAEVGCVFDLYPGTARRTPQQVMGLAETGQGQETGTGDTPARSANRTYLADLVAGGAHTVAALLAEVERRDPDHTRPLVILVDGDTHQITDFTREAERHGRAHTLVIDLIHVLGYLWKTAHAFHPARDPATEDWVATQAAAILSGHTAQVIDHIRDLAHQHPPKPGSEHAKSVTRTLSYLTNKQPYLENYPTALANGWPISTGVIEGACRHLVADRLALTGARWNLETAQAILSLRAIHASGAMDAYWDYHLTQEHQRNHTNHYQDGYNLTT